MFDIGWSELLVIAIVAIVVVGPKELPRVLRTFGNYAGKLKRTASEFRRQFDEAMAESELEDLRQSFETKAKEAEAQLKSEALSGAPAKLPPAPARDTLPGPRDESSGPPVALPGSPGNPMPPRTAKPKTQGAKPAAAKRAPAKRTKTQSAKTKTEPAP